MALYRAKGDGRGAFCFFGGALLTAFPNLGGGLVFATSNVILGICILLALIFLLFGLWIPETFLTMTTFKVVLADQVVVGILALAILIPLTAGVFDLSVGAMLAFSLVIVSWFQANTQMNALLACVLALLCCAGVGFLSGLIVVRFRVDSFIATLGMSQILTAAALYLSENKQITGVLSPTFLDMGRREVFGIPRIGKVAGCMVVSGAITRGSKVRFLREGVADLIALTRSLPSLNLGAAGTVNPAAIQAGRLFVHPFIARYSEKKCVGKCLRSIAS